MPAFSTSSVRAGQPVWWCSLSTSRSAANAPGHDHHLFRHTLHFLSSVHITSNHTIHDMFVCLYVQCRRLYLFWPMKFNVDSKGTSTDALNSNSNLQLSHWGCKQASRYRNGQWYRALQSLRTASHLMISITSTCNCSRDHLDPVSSNTHIHIELYCSACAINFTIMFQKILGLYWPHAKQFSTNGSLGV